MVKTTKYFSYCNKSLVEGCKQCVKGKKLVLFITGICNKNCFYCPLSPKKKNKDVIYANERKITSKKISGAIRETIEEAKKQNATGMGITGGDPLLKIDRTIKFIKSMKNEFGKDFHVHLYSSPVNITETRLNKLYEAGLDEIRFHPDLLNMRYWNKINLALDDKYKWKVGIEIPIIPLKEYEKKIIFLVNKFKDKVDFFNFNELEISDATIPYYSKLNLHVKDDYSYAIKGSMELGLKIMELFPKTRIHLCSAKLKDAVQMKNRLVRTAKNTQLGFDNITSDGLLLRGAIYLNENTAKSLNPKEQKILKDLIKKLNFKESEYFLDKNRVILSINKIKKLKDKIKEEGGKPCILAEYPTFDGLIAELEWL